MPGREGAIADQGDLSQILQGFGHGGAVLLRPADELPGMVVDGDARLSQSQKQLAAVDGIDGGAQAGVIGYGLADALQQDGARRRTLQVVGQGLGVFLGSRLPSQAGSAGACRANRSARDGSLKAGPLIANGILRFQLGQAAAQLAVLAFQPLQALAQLLDGQELNELQVLE
jgi:hypothetical protein